MRVFETELIFEPKTYDIDFAGVVSNQVYIRWLEDLRFYMIENHLGWEKFSEGLVPFLIRTEIDYLKSLRLHEKCRGTMWISGADRVRLHLEAEFVKLSTGEKIATARHIVVWINLKTGRPTRIPPPLRDYLGF